MYIHTHFSRRVQCWYMWNTSEGGPCIFRPVPYASFDAPNPEQAADQECLMKRSWEWEKYGVDAGPCQVRPRCPNAKCNEDNILVDAKKVSIQKVNVNIPWSETMTYKAKIKRWLMGNDVR